MFCKYCGKEIEDGKEVCEECASKETETKVEENVVIEEPKEETTNNETVKDESAKDETTTQTYVNTNSATGTNTNTTKNQKSKVGAGIMGILLGALGVHNFYLGYTGKAVAQLLITILSCGCLAPVSGIWGLIEGILILTGDINKDANGNDLKD